jgi:para-nitrobenzyl esterase
VRDASAFGATALKGASGMGEALVSLVPDVIIPGDDCLNLNVWTSDTGGSRPVMVWIHGGAFTSGAGSVSIYDGAEFAKDGIVLVTLNYRLSAEGFLLLDDVTPNLGLLDQIAALHWVQDNIAAFGGDPKNVTVVGESSGAMSIGALLAIPRARFLFHRAILESGAAAHVINRRTAHLIAHQLADMLGVKPTLEAISKVPLNALLAAQGQLCGDAFTSGDVQKYGDVAANLMAFEPIIDGDVLPAAPEGMIAAGASAGVDILIGSNMDEFRLFLVPDGSIDHITDGILCHAVISYGLDPDSALPVYRNGHPNASSGDLLAAVSTDWFYRIPAIRLAEAHLQHHKGSTYLYEFGWRPPSFGGRIGACHFTEFTFAFNNIANKQMTPLLGPEPPRAVAEAMHAAWIAFATTGNPGWPAYDLEHRTTQHFNTISHRHDDPRPDERRLWDGHR